MGSAKSDKKSGFSRWLSGEYQGTSYGVHSIRGGVYRYMPDGGFKTVSKPVQGATAEFENGADISSRTTLTRVLSGAVIAGPVGAIVGGMFKKDRARVYGTITFPDGEVAIIDAPAKDERKVRDFIARVNQAA